MAKRDLKDVLRQLATELDEEDRSEALEARLQALEQRQEEGATITAAQVLAALEAASDEELEALHGSVLDRLAREVEEEREPKVAPPPPPELELVPPPAEQTRPGRKQGAAYNWTVDDEGNVHPLDVARVWNEPSEADTVALPEPEIIEEEAPPA